MDVYGHVNNTEFLRLLEQARVQALPLRREPGVTGFLVVRNEIEYLRPLPYQDEPVSVVMWCTALRGADFDLGYEVVTDPGAAATVHAIAATTLVAYDFPTERPRRLTTDEREHLAAISGPPIEFRRRRPTTP